MDAGAEYVFLPPVVGSSEWRGEDKQLSVTAALNANFKVGNNVKLIMRK